MAGKNKSGYYLVPHPRHELYYTEKERSSSDKDLRIMKFCCRCAAASMPANSPYCTEELDMGSNGSSSTHKETSDIIPIIPDIRPPEEWEASKVLDQKTRNGVQYYLLVWMPSWVPEVHMPIVDGCYAGVWLHEEEWGISGIRETKMMMGMLHYLVEWLPSWVSELDAGNAPELIKEWHATWGEDQTPLKLG